jgi:hypothetical protein
MRPLLLLAALLTLAPISLSRGQLLGFEDLNGDTSSSISTTQSSGLQYINGTSGSLYGGVVWDTRITVVGIDARVDTSTPGPRFSLGAPLGGNYYITNDASFDTSDPATAFGNGITLTTSQVLTGAWFGAVQYYGFSDPGGTSSVSITAMSGLTPLLTLNYTLPVDGSIDPDTRLYIGDAMGYFDTSAFENLHGITGYVIDRADTSYPSDAQWVADNFNFVSPSATPEPSSWVLALTVITVLGLCLWRKRLLAQT